MKASDTGVGRGATQQIAVCSDDAADIAASVRILLDKWFQLKNIGMYANGGDIRQIARFAELSHATFPDDLARRLEAAQDNPAEGLRIGVEYATTMADRLLDEGAPGLHYITLNRSTATLEIHRNILGSRSTHALAHS